MFLFFSSHNLKKTGGHYRFDYLASHSIKDGHNLWLTPYRNDLILAEDSCILYKAPKHDYFFILRLLLSIFKKKRQLKEIRKDVTMIIVFGEDNLFAAICLKFFYSCKLSVGVRSDVPKLLKLRISNKKGISKFLLIVKCKLKLFYLKLSYNMADQIVLQSNEALQDFANYYKIERKKLFKLENNLPSPIYKRHQKIIRIYKERPKSLLYVGTTDERKGYDFLLNIIEELSTTVTSFKKVVIVGAEKKASIKLTNDICVEYLGHRDDIFDLMLESDLLIVPSKVDAFPNVILEAISSGLPCIGSDIDGIRSILYQDFLLFKSDSLSSALETLSYVSKPEGYMEAIVTMQKNYNKFSFNWPKKYLEVLESYKVTDSI